MSDWGNINKVDKVAQLELGFKHTSYKKEVGGGEARRETSSLCAKHLSC